MRRFARDRRSPTLRRSCAAVALLLAFAAQVGSFAHVALVRHALCLEHGELTHIDAHDAGVRAASGDPRRSAVDSRGDAAAEHGHDHCALAAHRRASILLRGCSRLPIELCAQARVDAPLALPAPLAGRALLCVAPKCSPPA